LFRVVRGKIEAVGTHMLEREPMTGPLGSLRADEVVLVWRPLATPVDEVARLHRTLTVDERGVSARYHFARDRDRSVVSRGTLRALLGVVLGRAPATLELVTGPHGKPSLRGGELEVNVSHGDEHLLIGITRGRALGVDVEGGDHALDPDELAPTVFTATERAALATYEGDARREAFLRGWTRKEAYLKARSVGLSMPLTDFSVSLDAQLSATLSSDVNPAEAARFRLVGLPAPPRYQAAACWSTEGEPVRRLRTAEWSALGVG
jgi:4'-phosphopantetheinyl transferase